MVSFQELVQRKHTSISDHTNFSILIECQKREHLKDYYLAYYAHYSLKKNQWRFELKSVRGYTKEEISNEKENIEKMIRDISKGQREKKLERLQALFHELQFTYDYIWEGTYGYQKEIILTNASVAGEQVKIHLYIGKENKINQMIVNFPIKELLESSYRAGHTFTFTTNVMRTHFLQLYDFVHYLIHKSPDRLKWLLEANQ